MTEKTVYVKKLFAHIQTDYYACVPRRAIRSARYAAIRKLQHNLQWHCSSSLPILGAHVRCI